MKGEARRSAIYHVVIWLQAKRTNEEARDGKFELKKREKEDRKRRERGACFQHLSEKKFCLQEGRVADDFRGNSNKRLPPSEVAAFGGEKMNCRGSFDELAREG